MLLQDTNSTRLPCSGTKKKKAYEANETATLPSVGYPEQTIFSSSQEKILNGAAAKFGMRTKKVRSFAYKLAAEYNKKFSPSWIDQVKFGCDLL